MENYDSLSNSISSSQFKPQGSPDSPAEWNNERPIVWTHTRRVSLFIAMLLMALVLMETITAGPRFLASVSIFAVSSITTDAVEPSNFSIIITSDYDNSNATEIFPWSIVEPYRPVHFRLLKDSSIMKEEHKWILSEDSTGNIVSNFTGPEFHTVFEMPGKLFTLQASWNNFFIELPIACRYVRRELRSLISNDLEMFLDTLHLLYSISQEDGMRTYGHGFSNMRDMTKQHAANVYDEGGCTPFHFNMAFYNGHAAIILRVERVMQLIEPRTAMHYWNFISDGAAYGADWANRSIIFDDGWFGSADSGLENDFIVSKGRWAFTERSRVDNNFNASHNAYGLMVGEWNNNPVHYIQRAQSVCGLSNFGSVFLPTCSALETMVMKFSENGYTSFEDVIQIISGTLHGWCHMFIGGAWNCGSPDNVADTLIEHPEWHPWIHNAMEDIWQLWSSAMLSGVIECPRACSESTPFSECRCITKNFDLENLTYADALEILDKTKTWEWLSGDFDDEFDSSKPDDIMPNSEEAFIWLARLVANAGTLGDFATPFASTMDPIFWPLHTFLIKIADTARVNPSFQPMNMSWHTYYKGAVFPEDRVCYGTHSNDKSPVTSGQMNIGVDTYGPDFHYTNEQLISILHLIDGKVPYVYDSWVTGTCMSNASILSLD